MLTGTNSASASSAMTTGLAASKDFMASPCGRRGKHGAAIWQFRDGSGPGAGKGGRAAQGAVAVRTRCPRSVD